MAVPTAYALLIAIFTLPALFRLRVGLVGNNVDNWIFYWNNWQLGQALSTGADWYFTPYLFYPQGSSLLTHSNSFLSSLLALALTPLTGPVAAYNLTVLLGLWLRALGMFYLVRELTGRTGAGFLAGAIFAFAPYGLTKSLSQMHLGALQWWPWGAYFWERAYRRDQPWAALLSGFCAALTLWTGLHLALLWALWLGARLLWQLASAPDCASRRRLLRLGGLLALAAFLISLPVLLPLLESWASLSQATAQFDESLTDQTDLLAYLTPPTYNLLVGRQVVPIYERFLANRASMPYLGYTALALAFLGLVAGRREAYFWGVTGGLWLLLAAGAQLRFNGQLYPALPLPYRWLGDLFPLSAIRAPDRFNLLLGFSLSVLAGWGVAWLWERRRAWLLPLSFCLILEYAYLPFPLWELPPTSPFIHQLAQDDAVYGIIDYPLGYTNAKLWLYYQTLHGKPTLEGHISRYTADTYARITGDPLLRALYQAAERPPRLDFDPAGEPPPSALGPLLRGLTADNIRYLLVHKPYMTPAQQVVLDEAFPLLPIYEDALLAAYDLRDPWPLYENAFPWPLGETASLLHFYVAPDAELREWRIQMILRLENPVALPLACELQLSGEGQVWLQETFAPFAESPTAWIGGDLWHVASRLMLPALPPPGRYRWQLDCGAGARYEAEDVLSVSAAGDATYRRPAALSWTYGELLRLQGYRLARHGSHLEIELHWEALVAPDADYKIFIHLVDAEGRLVGQVDTMPCAWHCPTSGWQAGDRVVERLALPLWNLPPGEYRLAVGLYHPLTQERLPVAAPDGALYPDAYPLLPTPWRIRAE